MSAPSPEGRRGGSSIVAGSGSATHVVPTVELAAPASDKLDGRRWWRLIAWRHVLGIVAVVYTLFPVWYLLSASFNRLGSLSSTSFWPSKFSFTNYAALFTTSGRPFFLWYLNTIIVCVVVVAFQVFFSALAAYAFSRLRWRGRRTGLFAVLMILMFPQLLVVVALYQMFSVIGQTFPFLGLDTLPGYMLVLLGGSLGNVYLVKGFFDTIPMELDEAAKLDGAGHAGVFFRIVVPLVRTIIVITGLISLVSVLGEYMIASVFLRSTDTKTLAIGLYTVLESDMSNNLGWFAAASILIAIPVVVLFVLLQKYIVGGITSGSVKG